MRAAQNLQVQKIRKPVIVVIGRRAGDVAEDILALRRLANLDEVIVAFVGEDILAELEHGSFPLGAATIVAACGIEHCLDDRLVAGTTADIAA